jgi:thioredoxin reductase (NADPH)
MNYEVIVVGAGAAGLSAASWCDELGLKTIVLEQSNEIGGQLLHVFNPIENHLGAPPVRDGRELRDLLQTQISKRNFELKLNARIFRIDAAAKQIFMQNGEILSSLFVVLATGVRRRKLNVSGETEFVGRGVLESGKRAAEKVAGKTVVVVGGGDAAAENALILSATAQKVYLVHRRGELRARREFAEKVKAHPHIELLTETRLSAICGTEKVESAVLQKNDGKPFEISCDFILIRAGVEPNTDFFRDQIKTDSLGYVEINHLCETSAANVFAVGDVANPSAPTVSTAIGTGATAAKVIAEKSRGGK